MGKKNKDQEPVASLNGVGNRDIVQRINFLYQASTYLGTVVSPGPELAPTVAPVPPSQGPRRRKRKKNTVRHPKSAAELSRAYVGSMRIVGQKTMVRMDPSIKRTLCRQCDTVLIPGSTTSVRVKPSGSHGQAVVYTCLACGSSRRIPAPQVLDPDAPNAVDTNSPAPAHTTPGAVASTSAEIWGNVAAMDVDTAAPAATTTAARQGKKPRKRVARVPPLFERKGHVVFRGNEMLTDQ